MISCDTDFQPLPFPVFCFRGFASLRSHGVRRLCSGLLSAVRAAGGGRALHTPPRVLLLAPAAWIPVSLVTSRSHHRLCRISSSHFSKRAASWDTSLWLVGLGRAGRGHRLQCPSTSPQSAGPRERGPAAGFALRPCARRQSSVLPTEGWQWVRAAPGPRALSPPSHMPVPPRLTQPSAR